MRERQKLDQSLGGVRKLDAELSDATGLIEIAEDVAEIEEGELVAFVPFSEFGRP